MLVVYLHYLCAGRLLLYYLFRWPMARRERLADYMGFWLRPTIMSSPTLGGEPHPDKITGLAAAKQ
jgi:hypothetical protein